MLKTSLALSQGASVSADTSSDNMLDALCEKVMQQAGSISAGRFILEECVAILNQLDETTEDAMGVKRGWCREEREVSY